MGPLPYGHLWRDVVGWTLLGLFIVGSVPAAAAQMELHRLKYQKTSYKIAVIYRPAAELRDQAIAEKITEQAMLFAMDRFIAAGTFPADMPLPALEAFQNSVFDGRTALLILARDHQDQPASKFSRSSIVATFAAAYLNGQSSVLPLRTRLASVLSPAEHLQLNQVLTSNQEQQATTIELKRLAVIKGAAGNRDPIEGAALPMMLDLVTKFLTAPKAFAQMGVGVEHAGILLETNPRGLARLYQRLGAQLLFTLPQDPHMPDRGVALLQVKPGLLNQTVANLRSDPSRRDLRLALDTLQEVTADAMQEHSNRLGRQIDQSCQNLLQMVARPR